MSKKVDSMETIGITDSSSNETMSRRIEVMSFRKIFATLSVYCSCQILICLALIFGPSYYISQYMPFLPDPYNSSTRRISFDFSGFRIFNDFLSLDLSLVRPESDCNNEKTVNLSFRFSYLTGTGRNSSIFQPTRSCLLTFPVGSNKTESITVYQRSLINFTSMHSMVTLKFPEYQSFGGEFEWSFADPAISLAQIAIRFIFFAVGIAVFIYLVQSPNFHYSSTTQNNRYFFWMLILQMLSADPLYLLVYFSQNDFLKYFDRVMQGIFFAHICYVVGCSLRKSMEVHKDQDPNPFKNCSLIQFIRIVFYIITLVLFAGTSIYDTMRVRANVKEQAFAHMLIFARIGVVVVFLLISLFRGLFTKSEIKGEIPTMAILSGIMQTVIVLAETMRLTEEFIGAHLAQQVFEFMSLAVYCVFYGFFNWIVPAEEIGNEMELEEGQISGDQLDIPAQTLE